MCHEGEGTSKYFECERLFVEKVFGSKGFPYAFSAFLRLAKFSTEAFFAFYCLGMFFFEIYLSISFYLSKSIYLFIYLSIYLYYI